MLLKKIVSSKLGITFPKFSLFISKSKSLELTELYIGNFSTTRLKLETQILKVGINLENINKRNT